jgi:hypothetical protein
MASGGRIAAHFSVGGLAQVYPWAEVENAVRYATPLGLWWLDGRTQGSPPSPSLRRATLGFDVKSRWDFLELGYLDSP